MIDMIDTCDTPTSIDDTCSIDMNAYFGARHVLQAKINMSRVHWIKTNDDGLSEATAVMDLTWLDVERIVR